MRFKIMAAGLAALTVFGLSASAQVPTQSLPKTHVAEAPPAPITPTPAPTLTKQDVDGWLDGVMPYSLSSGDIAGAVVVVVKDGQVLTEKGYGYADVKAGRKVDPKATLFRAGSVGKLFTWTAVMQLVESSKLDLDRDVNAYIDFKIPPREGKPVTLRELMTHTPGFEEHIKALVVAKPGDLKPIGDYLKAWVPLRIFPPGEVPAYSNYGATLAGYIVQRVSGEPYDDYIERHILVPLQMSHSTFRQPLPAGWPGELSAGYGRASEPAHPFELFSVVPAGSLTTTADDMARFMTAHLRDGPVRLLQPATTDQMFRFSQHLSMPLEGMALGFYHEDRNGRRVVGHAGDSQFFHSDLHLMPDEHVGLFVSLNSTGKAGAAGAVRTALYRGFVDRYFPAPRPHLPTTATAKAHAQLLQGRYRASRRSEFSFFNLLGLLGQAKVTANPDGTVVVPGYTDFAGATKVWREVGPFVWKDANDDSTMVAKVRDGKVVGIYVNDEPPVNVMQPVPGWRSAGWNLPLLFAMVAVLVLGVLVWPVSVLVRRRYGRSFSLTGRRALLHRLTKATAVVDLAALGALAMLGGNLARGLEAFNTPLDATIRIAQLLCLIGSAGAIAAVWNAVLVVGDGASSRWVKAGNVLLAAACVAFVWFTFSLGLITPGLDY